MLEAAIFATIMSALVISLAGVLSWLTFIRHRKSATFSAFMRGFWEFGPFEIIMWLYFFIGAGGLG